MVRNSRYLTISEFSKIAGLNRKTLIFYDNSGLFSPCFTAENGYRYYSHEQIYMVSVISLLKEFGMSHQEIKRHMQEITPQSTKSMLIRQEKIISARIGELEGIKAMIKERRKSLEEGMKENRDVEIISLEETPIFISDEIDKMRRDIPDSDWMSFYEKQKGRKNDFGYPEGYIIESTESSDRVRNIISYVGSRKYSNAAIPKGEYLSISAHGDLDDTGDIYRELRKYAQENELALKSPVYEKMLIDIGSVKSKEEQILRIIVPFERMGSLKV